MYSTAVTNSVSAWAVRFSQVPWLSCGPSSFSWHYRTLYCSCNSPSWASLHDVLVRTLEDRSANPRPHTQRKATGVARTIVAATLHGPGLGAPPSIGCDSKTTSRTSSEVELHCNTSLKQCSSSDSPRALHYAQRSGCLRQQIPVQSVTPAPKHHLQAYGCAMSAARCCK